MRTPHPHPRPHRAEHERIAERIADDSPLAEVITALADAAVALITALGPTAAARALRGMADRVERDHGPGRGRH